jgi:UDP-N-acetyl-D-mannosaminuronate dehydrogenase
MINVIGLGYIGLPTALMLASHGVEVIGTDYNKELIETLNAGKMVFREMGWMSCSPCREGWDPFHDGVSEDGHVHRFRPDSV